MVNKASVLLFTVSLFCQSAFGAREFFPSARKSEENASLALQKDGGYFFKENQIGFAFRFFEKDDLNKMNYGPRAIEMASVAKRKCNEKMPELEDKNYKFLLTATGFVVNKPIEEFTNSKILDKNTYEEVGDASVEILREDDEGNEKLTFKGNFNAGGARFDYKSAITIFEKNRAEEYFETEELTQLSKMFEHRSLSGITREKIKEQINYDMEGNPFYCAYLLSQFLRTKENKTIVLFQSAAIVRVNSLADRFFRYTLRATKRGIRNLIDIIDVK